MFSVITLFKVILRHAFRSGRAVAGPRVYPSLGLEPLEARDVPATTFTQFCEIVIAAGMLGLLPSGSGSGQERSSLPSRGSRLSKEEIQQLITRLGSQNFSEREAATKALKRRPEAALMLLRASRTAKNPEVNRRLRSILPVMMSREGAEKRLSRLSVYVKNRQLDRLVETLVACREFITSEHDSQVRAFMHDIYTSATGGKKHTPTADQLPDFKTFAWENRFGKVDSDTPTLVTMMSRPLSGAGTGVIAADGISGDNSLFRGVAICNGEVDIRATIDRSLVITTGRVRAYSIHTSVVVSPENIVANQGDSASVIVSGNKLVANGDLDGYLGWSDKTDSVIREHDKEFFATWHLYIATEAGATLWSAFGVVGVGKVFPGSPLARAGIGSGDILARVDGTAVRSVRDATRLLCRATVTWGATELTVINSGQRRDVIVPLRDW